MRRQSIKDVYYSGMKQASRVLYFWYRNRYRHQRGPVRLHLGCGANYIDGFVNIEGNFQRRCDCLLDLTVGLPFEANSVSFIYSCHMLEHLYIEDAIELLRECHRVLRPGAYARFTLPDARFAFEEVLQGVAASEFPRSFECRMGRAMNFLFCDGQHRFGYSLDILAELALSVGFSRTDDAVIDRDPNLPSLSEPAGSFAANLFKAGQGP